MAKDIIGTVLSKKCNKTIVVGVENHKVHPLYDKRYTVTSRYAVHDENNIAKVGDKVSIKETRPISKTKHFALVKILENSKEHLEINDGTEATK